MSDIEQRHINEAEKAVLTQLGKPFTKSVEAIATALAAAEKRGREEERERCAKIAARHAPATQDFADAPLQALAMAVAAAIRQPSTGGEG